LWLLTSQGALAADLPWRGWRAAEVLLEAETASCNAEDESFLKHDSRMRTKGRQPVKRAWSTSFRYHNIKNQILHYITSQKIKFVYQLFVLIKERNWQLVGTALLGLHCCAGLVG
jgi:hypothetical protein